ncbi:MAG: hypothetical protein Q9218_008038, partial [Villophora microphyllina]
PSHPLWNRFWSDPLARPFTPKATLYEEVESIIVPGKADPAYVRERAEGIRREDEAYEELLRVCREAREWNEDVGRRERKGEREMEGDEEDEEDEGGRAALFRR